MKLWFSPFFSLPFGYFIFKWVGVLNRMVFELLFGKKKKSQNKPHLALQLPMSHPLIAYLGG